MSAAAGPGPAFCCGECEASKPVAEMQACSACKSVFFCDKTCFATSWKKAGGHKPVCVGLREALAEGGRGWAKTVTEPGPDAAAKAPEGAEVEVTYVGRFANGKVFDQSSPERGNFKFALGAGMVIQGWDKCVATMAKGEKCTAYISAPLAYGARGAGGAIPPNTHLVFDIELLGWKEK